MNKNVTINKKTNTTSNDKKEEKDNNVGKEANGEVQIRRISF